MLCRCQKIILAFAFVKTISHFISIHLPAAISLDCPWDQLVLLGRPDAMRIVSMFGLVWGKISYELFATDFEYILVLLGWPAIRMSHWWKLSQCLICLELTWEIFLGGLQLEFLIDENCLSVWSGLNFLQQILNIFLYFLGGLQLECLTGEDCLNVWFGSRTNIFL